jgi:acid phosphatase
MRIHAFLCALLCAVAADEVNVVSVGDWGSAALGGYHLKNAEATANALQHYVDQYGPKLILNPGDNFYYCGIQNGSDPQINEDFVGLFGAIQVPWYNALGNHDYGFNPDAQLQLNETVPTWIMDGRYYHRRIELAPSMILNVIVLDTNPCVADYRGNDRAKWDPCGLQYPTCEPIAEKCMFHENILNQECKPQLDWFNHTLDSIDAENEWVFVVGHHKANEINVENFQALLSDDRVHLYINGHEHNLEHYSIEGMAKYMTSGAGGMVIGHILRNYTATLHKPGQRVQSMWLKVITGFASHTFFDNYSKVLTEFWDTKQNVIYNFTLSHP